MLEIDTIIIIQCSADFQVYELIFLKVQIEVRHFLRQYDEMCIDAINLTVLRI